jgi:small subunit ribosomal protein S3
MKGEVYGKRSFPLAGMDKKQAGGKGGDSPRKSNFNKGGKPDARKRK